MEKRQIVNIINFIRAVEPREPVDMLLPVKKQIQLMKEYNLRGTFLVQYDALIDPAFTDLLKELDPTQFEIGVWFEIVQPMVERIGLTWRGRFPWDWHVHCGFSMGYTPAQREQLIDTLYEEFKSVFGYYPRVFGSWFFDSHTIRYLSDKYGVDALCNCKEQHGTDGYTLWGGYYGQGYYPSRTNVFMPAQNLAEQIPAPLFRMLGSDPVYQYDFGLSPESGAEAVQGVITLEPAYLSAGGGNPAWVDWYMRENFNGECLSFGYAQAGQENSFSWPGMEQGLTYQFSLFAKLQQEGKIVVEPLGETGRWYKQTYATTPASAITAHSAYNDEQKNSLWYCSKFYRTNLYCDHGKLRIRDLHLFREDYPDPFEDKVCVANEATYETLPIVDGNIHSGNHVIAGLYFTDAKTGRSLTCNTMHFTQAGSGAALVDYGSVRFTLMENSIKISADTDFILESRVGKTDRHFPTLVSCTDTHLCLRYNGAEYGVELTQGRFDGAGILRSEDSILEAHFI